MLWREFRKIEFTTYSPELSKYQINSDQLDLLNSFDKSVSRLEKHRSTIDGALISTDEQLVGKEDKSMNKKAPDMLLIIDTETTGLDADKDECIEVGAILFNVSNRASLAQLSFLIPVSCNKAESINRIRLIL